MLLLRCLIIGYNIHVIRVFYLHTRISLYNYRIDAFTVLLVRTVTLYTVPGYGISTSYVISVITTMIDTQLLPHTRYF